MRAVPALQDRQSLTSAEHHACKGVGIYLKGGVAMLYMGVDLGKRKSSVAVVDEEGHIVLFPGCINLEMYKEEEG